MQHRFLDYRHIGTVIFLSGMALTQAVSAQTSDNIAGASMLANTCAGCHGTNGSSAGPASPSIAGISTGYFIKTMKDYASGNRPSTVMKRIATGYNEKEITLMAEYFARQTFNRPSQDYDTGKAKQGKALHKQYCESCHVDGGRSPGTNAGILAGQWAAYLRFTMEDFISGRREMIPAMGDRLDALREDHGDKAIDQLIHYYASQSD